MAADLQTEDWRQLAEDALAGIKGVGRALRQRIAEDYAPKFAQIADAPDPETAGQRFDALVTNLRLLGRVYGIKGETEGLRFIKRALRLLAATAARLVVA